MSTEDIILAWKDLEYRGSLSEEQLSQLPENPAGMLKLTDAEMEAVTGGVGNCLGLGCGSHHVCPTKDKTCFTVKDTKVCCMSKSLPCFNVVNVMPVAK